MQLAEVVGNVVATVKAPGLGSHKLLLVRGVDPSGSGAPDADVYAAVDFAGAGEGDVVLVARGSGARIHHGAGTVPTDAAIIAIVDNVQFESRVTYRKH